MSLELSTTDELVGELKTRFPAGLLVLEDGTKRKKEDMESTVSWLWGPIHTVAGLCFVAESKINHVVSKLHFYNDLEREQEDEEDE